MTDEIDLLQRFMELPETNKAVINILLDDFMAPAEYIAALKAQAFVWSEPDHGNLVR